METARHTLCDTAEPRNVLPRQAGVNEGLLVKYEHRTAEQAGTRTYTDGSGNTLIFLDLLALLDFGPSRVVDLLHPHVFLAASELRCVHCDEKTLDTTLLGMLYVFLRDLPIAVDVELQEEYLVVGLRVHDVVKRARRKRGDLHLLYG